MLLCFSISSHLILSITVFNCVKLPFSKNQVYVLTGQDIALLLFVFSLNSIYCLGRLPFSRDRSHRECTRTLQNDVMCDISYAVFIVQDSSQGHFLSVSTEQYFMQSSVYNLFGISILSKGTDFEFVNMKCIVWKHLYLNDV